MFAVFGFVQRRLGNVDVAAFDQLGHLAVEEGQEQGADVRAVHVGIGHDDDAVVAQFFGIEFFFADACAQSGNQRGDFLAGQHFFKILPLSGKIAWNLRSRPCMAEPPAESPSTR